MKTERIEVPAAALAQLAGRELASIASIDAAMGPEREPGYVMLLRTAKSGKQANVEQLVNMLRAAGIGQIPPASPLQPMLELQSKGLARIGTTPLLRAMRLVETMIVAQYEELLGTMGGVFGIGFEKCWRRARKQLVVLTAHIAIRGAKPEIEEQLALPLPLSHYFAHGEPRVCFRCLFDRPGPFGPLERTDPHPYTYVCARCHEEVFGDLPPDVMESAPKWTTHDRQSRIIEHALGRPSKLKAEMVVLAKMSGLSPDMPPPPLPRKTAQDMSRKDRRKAPAGVANFELGNTAPEESTYIEKLFNYESVKEWW